MPKYAIYILANSYLEMTVKHLAGSAYVIYIQIIIHIFLILSQRP